jgi:ribonuclease PH
MRIDGRAPDQIRPVRFTTDFVHYPEGSILIAMGETLVLCNATVEETLPRWLQNKGREGGWVTAEYAMLPRATRERTQRETRGISGRSQEIRRLIGRSLRASVDLKKIGPRTVIVDCDVLQADGGTRTASITGGYLALTIALRKLIQTNQIPESALLAPVAAISAGIVDGQVLLDLNYAEDSQAEVDINVVMNRAGEFVEVQGTAEGEPFSQERLEEMLGLSRAGIDKLLDLGQRLLVDTE